MACDNKGLFFNSCYMSTGAGVALALLRVVFILEGQAIISGMAAVTAEKNKNGGPCDGS